MVKRIITIAIVLFGIMPLAVAQTGTWSGALELQGSSLSLVFHLDDNPSMDSPDQGVRGIPAQVERTETGQITIKVPAIGASYEGQWMINKIAGTFKQMNVSIPVTLTPGEPGLKRPQTPKGPFPYEQEEVSFTSGDAILNGTLVLPEGCTRKTPVLIMVTGSGIQNRDEEIFEHKPFAVIADALARAGIATYRYDDRGLGKTSEAILNLTTEDFKNDALAGIRMLRERFDKVGIIGHSEGGTIAFLLAAEGEADFIVSLAGMVVSGKEALVWQNRQSLLAAGLPEENVKTYCNAISEAFDVIVDGGIMPKADELNLPEALKQNFRMVLTQIQAPYMRYLLALDARPCLGKISCPVLAFNGTKDLQVDYKSNLAALRSGLPAGDTNLIEPVEGVNHLFQHCTTGQFQEYRQIEESFSPEVLETMVRWLSRMKP